MAKMTRNEMRQVVTIVAKHINNGKDKEAVIKLATRTLMEAGVTSFDFFDLKSFEDTQEARIIDVIYKLMCKVETLKHQDDMRRIAKAGKVSPATAAQRRIFDEQVRLFNEQNLINQIHHNF